jgi:hypothetical protein
MTNIFQRARLRLGVAAAIASTIVAAGTVSAQPFEYVFGEKNTVETGARRVKPVELCPDGGFIAVGTTANAPAPTDVYLVRTKDDGSPIWEFRYDIGPDGVDRGQALAEASDGSGFVVAGSTRKNSTGAPTHAFLLKVRCDGKPLWSQVYVSHGGNEQALDLVEAQSGDPAVGTSRGDLLVAGFASGPNYRDAMLFRTRADGSILWNFHYDHDGAIEMFRGLTEAKGTSPGTGTGDVVAVGYSQKPGGTPMGYAIRVNGNNGSYAFGDHDAVLYPAADLHIFESVVELRNSSLGGELVFTGVVTNPTTSLDITLLRTKPDPAGVLAGMRIGDPATEPLGAEWAMDLHEVSNSLGIARPGDLALTGRVGSSAFTDADAFLLIASPDSLKPAATGWTYGDHDKKLDWGVSVSDHKRGFVISGTSQSDFEHASDPSDLYLVGPDDNGKTGCSREWQPRYEEFVPHVEVIDPRQERFLDNVVVDVKFKQLSNAFPNCP